MPATVDQNPPRFRNRPGSILPMALALLLSGCVTTTDVQFVEGVSWQQGTLRSATEIRQMIGPMSPAERTRNDMRAKSQYDAGLAAWRTSPRWTSVSDPTAFDNGLGKLVDAYATYLLESSQPANAVQVFQTAVAEADSKREYQQAIAYRIRLADTLSVIGQLERAQSTLTDAQAVQDKVYGPLPATVSAQNDPSQTCNQAAIWAAQIRSGKVFGKAQLNSFASYYDQAVSNDPRIRYCDPSVSWMNYQSIRAFANDKDLYRKDQDFWRAMAGAALKANEVALAKSAVAKMTAAANAAATNTYPETSVGALAEAADGYMRNFHIQPYQMRVHKVSDTAYGLEVDFDTSLAGAELSMRYDDLAQAEALLAHAQQTFVTLKAYSDELRKRGHFGLKSEQRTREWQRVMAKVHLRHQRWQEALGLLEPYLAWSETFRDSLSLEERLPYFRGTSQGAYQDAILAHAALYNQTPSERAFDTALVALGKLKARHLKDALEASGKTGGLSAASAADKVNALVRRGSTYFSVADAGDTLITYLADANGKTIRLARKSAGFDSNVLALRNSLAERRLFDTRTARNISALVLGNLEPRVFGQRPLVAEIDGPLSFLPVELWLDEKMTPLGAQSAVSYLPTLAMADAPLPASAGKGVLALGDARFDQTLQIDTLGATKEMTNRGTRATPGFAPLPETRDEINAILKNVREGGTAILGANATKAAFLQESEKAPYRYLHFATHGVVGGEIPRLNEPALVLTPEPGDPGFLTASEIGRLTVRSDLVVLSACNTGNGEYFNGEGLMGLGRAFILAGARAVVVSMWPVDSLTTKELMIHFYLELEKTGDARQALASARRAIMGGKGGGAGDSRNLQRLPAKTQEGDFKDRKNPFFWAPFVLIEASTEPSRQRQ